ncbi:hypothetical protein JXB41_00910 [Candidatus Woesearchaeota archaeon]|nr:hypothetical protein [Candidatus Woesearchaeota archaeon]
MNLLEWAVLYIKNKDLLSKKLVNLEVREKSVVCEFKDYKMSCFVEQDLADINLDKIRKGNIIVVCLNKKANVKFLAENWSKFILNPLFKIIFSNPVINDKWIICPYTHDKITEEAALKPGLISLFGSVEPVS